jgi:Tol biopolymer transport system component
MGTAFAVGMTRNGSLYYGLEAGMLDVYLATLDPVTGKLLAPPQPANPRQVGRNTSPAWSPDGRTLAYLSPDRSWLRVGTGGGSHNVSIRSVESGETREIALKEYVYQPSWSPDGRSLLATGGPTGARRIDVQTGAITPVPEAVRSMWEGVWAPNGKALFYSTAAEVTQGSAPGTVVIRVRDLETKREKELYRGPGSPWNLILSSDGTQLAFLSQERGSRFSALKVMPAAGGEVRELLRVKEPESITTIAWTPDGRHLLFARGNMARTDPRKQAAELYRIASAGGEPQPLGLAMKHLRDLRVHPDGRRIAFTAGLGEMEIWVLENFLPAAPTAREAAR